MTQSRTHNCGELRLSDVGKNVTIVGWLENLRELGDNLGFAVLRDFYGYTQVVINTKEWKDLFKSIRCESTVQVSGLVRERSSKNPKMPTGEIEVVPEKVEVLGRCYYANLPFEIAHSTETSEDIRLKYRFLDLRNPSVKEKIILRCKIVSEIRRSMNDHGFLEITTPILTSSSPEGARDYLVPSRLYPGQFYALPQAPQQFKQLLMASGFDRYYQVAPCFRDEDARADRSPGEFYQLDIELAFASQDDVFAVLEDVLPPIFEKFGKYPSCPTPFRRITYRDALEKYGTDKPDLRINLIIQDVTELLTDCGFGPFEGKKVKAVVVHDFKQTRKFIDNMCSTLEKENEFKTFWVKMDDAGHPSGGIAKYVTAKEAALTEKLGLKPGSFVAFVSGDKSDVCKSAGVLRKYLGTNVEGCMNKDRYEFCWIVDFPMYEIGEESGELEFCHNPFSMPQGGMKALEEMNPLDILAYQYDIVCNGIELSSGAVRNHDPEIMLKAFSMVGIGEEEVKAKFPAMYNAFCYGAPPHAGIAPGIDRMVMLIEDEPNIREIIPFPMNRNAQDLMMGAPSPVAEKQLQDVHVAIIAPPKQEEK